MKIQADMKSARLKQLGLAFCLLVSLFVSSVSACTCSHHPEKVETETSSCHEHSEAANTEPTEHHSSDSNESALSVVPADECCCIEPAPRVFAKSETVKVEKQSAALPQSSLDKAALIAEIVLVKSIDFETPFYLTDSFYNLSPGRAPPVL